MSSIRIDTERFFLRPLEPADATGRYASWFADAAVKRYITAAKVMPSVEDLRDYIAARAGRDDVLFLGVFTRDTGAHIGNIKFEPLDRTASYAELGIMIGDPNWRCRGAAAEIITGANAWLAANRGIREIGLGVSCENAGAIRAYEKADFRPAPESGNHSREVVRMIWRATATRA